MLRPKRMARVIIIGSKRHFESTIDALHKLNVLHIEDFVTPNADFKLSPPLEKATEASELLLKLRSASKILGLDEKTPKIEKLRIIEDKDLRAKVGTLELNIDDIAAAKEKVLSALKELNDRIEQLRPFMGLKLPLEAYRGYESLVVFAGRVRRSPRTELANVVKTYELFEEEAKGEHTIALFVPKKEQAAALKLLMAHGFSELKVPEGQGYPEVLVARYQKDKAKLEQKLVSINTRLETLRRKHAQFILCTTEYLEIEIEKAEAPLRFATTDHSFIMEGWVPEIEYKKMVRTLQTVTSNSLYIERLSLSVEESEKIPVAFDNPQPARPFEMLVDLFSTPNYKELDPTLVLAFVFPLFYGLMIGDLGYGVVMILIGLAFRRAFADIEGLKAIGSYIIVAGLFASVFGTFLFGDAFGIPFTSETEHSWSSALGLHLPAPAIHKLEISGVVELLLISVLAGLLHLGLGLIFGFINEFHHSRKHAIGKIGWLFVLFAIGLLMLKMAENTSLGSWLWQKILFPFAASTSMLGLNVPYATLVCISLGLPLVLASEGAYGLIELPGMLSNVISYTRIAAIGVAKGAMALASNTILLYPVIGMNPGIVVLALIALFFLQAIIFVLGTLSAGIQAIRLHYVEFFLKFYKGGGIKYEPFGYRRRYTVAI